MTKKLLSSIAFFTVVLVIILAAIVIAGKSGKNDASDKTNISNEQQGQKSSENASSIDQLANDFLAESTAEQSAAAAENDEISQVSLESETINNLIQTYDENEF